MGNEASAEIAVVAACARCLPEKDKTGRYVALMSPLEIDWCKSLAAESSHRKIAVTTVAASGLATMPLQESQGCCFAGHKKSLAPSDFGVSLKIAGSSQRPRPQVAATARFRGRSDHRTLSKCKRWCSCYATCIPEKKGRSVIQEVHTAII